MPIPIIFETVLIHGGRASQDGSGLSVSPVSFFLLPDPNQISWSDTPMDDVRKTPDGAFYAKGGRGIPTCSIQGDFGIGPQQTGIMTSPGVEAQRRFEVEIVELGSAATKKQVDAAIKKASIGFTGEFVAPNTSTSNYGVTIGNTLSKRLASFDELNDVIAVNCYDFYNQHYHQIGRIQYAPRIAARGGGVSGLRPYNLSFAAVGDPIVSSSKAAWSLRKLSNVLPTWQSVNAFITGTSAGNLLNTAADTLNLVLTTSETTIAAVTGWLRDLTGVVNGSFAKTSPAISSLLGTVEVIANDFDSVRAATETDSVPEPSYDVGETDWSEEQEDAYLTSYDSAVTATQVADGYRFQLVAGKLYGMSRLEYRRFVEAGGVLGGRAPNVRLSVGHVVNVNDTPRSISNRYGVEWADIVRLNQSPTDSLLTVSETIQIPISRPWGAIGLEGLPVYGSHVGTSALGSDIAWPPTANAEGTLRVYEDVDCLAQGVRLTAYGEIQPMVVAASTDMPQVAVPRVIQQSAVQIFQTDPRVSSVSVGLPQIDDSLGLVRLQDITLRAINGAVIGV